MKRQEKSKITRTTYQMADAIGQARKRPVVRGFQLLKREAVDRRVDHVPGAKTRTHLRTLRKHCPDEKKESSGLDRHHDLRC